MFINSNAQEVTVALGQVIDGDEVTVTLEGKLEGGTPFLGYDEVILRAPEKR